MKKVKVNVNRVVRSGAASSLRVAYRNRFGPFSQSNYVGFRFARSKR